MIQYKKMTIVLLYDTSLSHSTFTVFWFGKDTYKPQVCKFHQDNMLQ